jgi:hypothetical protein
MLLNQAKRHQSNGNGISTGFKTVILEDLKICHTLTAFQAQTIVTVNTAPSGQAIFISTFLLAAPPASPTASPPALRAASHHARALRRCCRRHRRRPRGDPGRRTARQAAASRRRRSREGFFPSAWRMREAGGVHGARACAAQPGDAGGLEIPVGGQRRLLRLAVCAGHRHELRRLHLAGQGASPSLRPLRHDHPPALCSSCSSQVFCY